MPVIRTTEFTIPEGGKRYCRVCKKMCMPGEVYKSYHYGDGTQLGHHITCTPKKPFGSKPAITTAELPFRSDKRRRAGGHGYSGGDGFVDL